MREGWSTAKIGDICTLTKGTTPTQKAIPGPYPLVVTAAEFLSSNTYQFEGEAICVPLVSSTGHGHASLKRVHYASGRFAVANIITALQSKADAEVSMRYLWLLLDHGRDDIIVPLMKGTANVSLSQNSLASATVLLPPLDEQRRIVDLIGSVDDAIEAAERAEERIAQVSRANSVSLWDAGVEVTISEVGRLVTGATPSTRNEKFWASEDVPFVTPADLGWNGTEVPSCKVKRRVSQFAANSSTRRLDGHGVLQVCIGATAGKVGVLEGPMLFNQQINAISDISQNDARIVAASLSSPQFQRTLQEVAGTTTMPHISKSSWGSLKLHWPEVGEREEWASRLFALDEAGRRTRMAVDRLRNLRSNLLTALLSGEHEIPKSYDELREEAAT
ncbi:MAG TPA: restriction endonuclease subunit S [Jiangellaceae bacterium]|nr:restriction endonuclease subunit S [Jiangellaceae bacterium]